MLTPADRRNVSDGHIQVSRDYPRDIDQVTEILQTPVSQDQTLTATFLRRHCVVLKFQDQTITSLSVPKKFRTRLQPAIPVLVHWSLVLKF